MVQNLLASALTPVAVVGTGAIALTALHAAVAAPPAKATTPPQVLFLLQNGQSAAPEESLLSSAGYTVAHKTPANGKTMTAAQFKAYAALVIGDPSSGSCSSLTPTLTGTGSDLIGTTWQGAVTGNISVSVPRAELPGTSSASKLITGAVEYAAAGYNSGNQTGTGLYVSLNCDYSTAAAGTPVAFLNGVEDIGTASASGQAGPLTVQGGFACGDGGTANTWEAESSGTLSSLTTSMLSGTASWPAPSCPVEEGFDSWPANFTPLGYDTQSDATPNFTGSSGQSGQPYLLFGSPPLSASSLALAPSNGGEVPSMSVIGGTDADPVNEANGDFSVGGSDFSIPDFRPVAGFHQDLRLADRPGGNKDEDPGCDGVRVER